MTDLPSELRELLLQNSLSADVANGPGHVVPVDKAASICLMMVQREVAKVRIGHRNRELLGSSGRILAAMSVNRALKSSSESDDRPMARAAISRARALMEELEKGEGGTDA